MEDAQLYAANHVMQRRDVIELLQNASSTSILRPVPNQRVLDIGCGPGDTTASLLVPCLPSDSQVVGVDISSEMVKYARVTYSSPRLQFHEYDVECRDALITSSLGKFDKIFSFYTFHWIQNQMAAFQNVYDLLKSEGEILFLFLATSPIYNLFEKIASNPRWSKYMHDVKKYISPYHYSRNPCEEVKLLAKKLGYQNIKCSIQKRSFEFPSFSVLLKSIEAVDPFLRRVPNELRELFLADYKTELLKGSAIPSDHGEGYITQYKTITLYASKL